MLKGLQQVSDAYSNTLPDEPASAADEAPSKKQVEGDNGNGTRQKRGKRRRENGSDGQPDTVEARIELIGRCVELQERLFVTRQREECAGKVARAASHLRHKLQTLREGVGGGGEEGAGGGTILGQALAHELASAQEVIVKLAASTKPI